MNNYKAIKVCGKKIDEHRHIMQLIVGRKLDFNEVVHHIDGDKRNNNIENLKILSRSEHSSMHVSNTKLKEETKEKLRIINRKARTLSKLTDDDVFKIRNLLAQNVKSIDIAKKLNVSKYVVCKLKTINHFIG